MRHAFSAWRDSCPGCVIYTDSAMVSPLVEPAALTTGEQMDRTEFLRRWDAGEYAAVVDDPKHPAIRRLVALIPFAR